MNYSEIFEEEFSEVISKYHMNYLAVDRDESILGGKGFVLRFIMHLGEVYVDYITHGENGGLEYYHLSSFIFSKCKDEDKKGIDTPEHTAMGWIKRELKILNKCFLNHWDRMLWGDKKWMEEYLIFSLSGEAYAVDDDIAKYVLSVMQKNE